MTKRKRNRKIQKSLSKEEFLDLQCQGLETRDVMY